MKTKLTLVVALALSLATLTAFAAEQAARDSTLGGTTPPTTSPSTTAYPGGTTPGGSYGSMGSSSGFQSFQNLSDAQALSVIAAIDSNEIQAAGFVQSRKDGKHSSSTGMNSSTGAVTDKLEDFAEDLRKDHEKNLKDVTALAKKLNLTIATQTDPALTLKTEGKQGLSTLKSASGMDLERIYVNAMISGHQRVLQIIDTMTGSLTPGTSTSPSSTNGTSALSPQVRDFLTLTRATVAQHLQMAQDLVGQASMGGSTDLH
ncbi:MAG TPA: DUF4142 domain-containing protein [Candidatus Krumholzibacteria bacterium]|nr:DUF4142 domain-containing protein [Candidatus Krumholzibacteria bacterium]